MGRGIFKVFLCRYSVRTVSGFVSVRFFSARSTQECCWSMISHMLPRYRVACVLQPTCIASLCLGARCNVAVPSVCLMFHPTRGPRLTIVSSCAFSLVLAGKWYARPCCRRWVGFGHLVGGVRGSSDLCLEIRSIKRCIAKCPSCT